MSVSDVEISRDLAHAKVFVTALMPDQGLAAVKALKALAPELRYQLGKAVRMRHVPELHFHYDDSVDKGERIDSLLRDAPPPSTDSDP
jgi:ribosome-binding factor A